MKKCLHIGIPRESTFPVLRGWINESWIEIALNSLSDWDLRVFEYNPKQGFNVNDIASSVLDRKGPILIIQPVRSKDFELLRARLLHRFPIKIIQVQQQQDVGSGIGALVDLFEAGEPTLPRKYVVGLLILNKLVNLHMWGGKNKGYLWSHDIAKGRGVDDQFSDIAGEVVSLLTQNQILISKVSNSKRKYAANPDIKPEVYHILREKRFVGRIHDVLWRDPQIITTRLLDELDVARE